VQLSLQSVTRSYAARRVLDDVSLTVDSGCITALVGENGAGKSTLIRVASGLVAPDSGLVSVDNVGLASGDAQAHIRAGIGVVHQHFMLVSSMTVADNICLGAEPRTGVLGILVDRARVRREVLALCEKHKIVVNPDARVESLAVGERQRVEILKVLYRGAKILLLDEPTAVLSPREITTLLDTIRGLAQAGTAVLFVSHKLDEVFAVADTVTVLRRGKIVFSQLMDKTTKTEVAETITEHTHSTQTAPSERVRSNHEMLSLHRVNAEGLTAVTLQVRAGEVLGIAGVEGNGQRSLASVIAGLIPVSHGSLSLNGVDVTHANVASRRRQGVGYVPEDREGSGLVASLTVAENVMLGDPAEATEGGRFNRTKALERARAVIQRFHVRPDDPSAFVSELSGGNQQKVLMGRELARELKVLVIAQPTRGVDLGASRDIHHALLEARSHGVAIVLITSELDELRALSDRIAVMRGGTIVGEITPAEATDTRLSDLMVGAS
jgi:general nucleoside transport system ATP-binding protein